MNITLPQPLAPTSRRLRIFFWIALVVNLVHYAIFASVFARRFNDGSLSDSTSQAFLATYMVLMLFPGIFVGLVQLLLRDYFPDKDMPLSKRRMYNILGVIQLVFALPIAAFGVFAFYQLFHEGPIEHSHQGQKLMFYAWASAMVVASLLNGVAAVVVWRTVWKIRRNFRIKILEAFEQV